MSSDMEAKYESLTARLNRLKLQDNKADLQPVIEVHMPASTRKAFTETVTAYLMCMASSDGDEKAACALFLKKIADSDSKPEVKFFLRDKENELVSMNDALKNFNSPGSNSGDTVKADPGGKLIVKSTLKNAAVKSDPGEQLTVKSSTLENQAGNSEAIIEASEMKQIRLPKAGNPFLVLVPTVYDLNHFIIQPIAYRKPLNDLGEAMDQFYRTNKPEDDVAKMQVGRIFACQNEEKKWIRGILTNINADNSVYLRSVDYGYCVVVNFKHIYTLAPQFHKLPLLAWKAELAGIIPIKKNANWTLQDCLRFRELTAEKVMYCALVEDQKDDTISVILYDPSSYDVGDQMVKEGRAIDITTLK